MYRIEWNRVHYTQFYSLVFSETFLISEDSQRANYPPDGKRSSSPVDTEDGNGAWISLLVILSKLELDSENYRHNCSINS